MSTFDAGRIAQALGGDASAPFAPPPTDAASVGRALGHVSEQTMLRQEMESLTNGIERRNMRSMQKQSYVCSAACCDDEDSTAQQFQRCMKTCSLPVERANAIFQNEMQRFQNRIQRCTMDCQDQAQDEQGRAVDGGVIQANFTACTERCFAGARSSVPDLGQRLEMMMAPKTST